MEGLGSEDGLDSEVGVLEAERTPASCDLSLLMPPAEETFT